MSQNVDANVIQQADPSVLSSLLRDLLINNPETWLPGTHQCAGGQLPLSWNDVNALDAGTVQQVLAVTGPNHCIDGWSFLARSMGAMFSGDLHAARHMAYYAQLRAAMASLAVSGIGIFNGINFIIDASGTCKRLEGPGTAKGLATHKVVWKALELWATLPTSRDMILSAIAIGGVSFLELLRYIGISPSLLSLSSAIDQWGYDLSRGKDEHRDRNISSYAPHFLNNIEKIDENMVSYLAGIWKSFQPDGMGSFPAIDKYLLRQVLWDIHSATEPDKKIGDASSVVVRGMNSFPEAVKGIFPLEFLSNVADEHVIIKKARDVSEISSADSMVARACILLRIATALTRRHLIKSGIEDLHIRPWIDRLGRQRGFWRLPRDILATETWIDVEDVLEAVESLIERPDLTCFEQNETIPNGLPTITQAERIGMWGLELT